MQSGSDAGSVDSNFQGIHASETSMRLVPSWMHPSPDETIWKNLGKPNKWSL